MQRLVAYQATALQQSSTSPSPPSPSSSSSSEEDRWKAELADLSFELLKAKKLCIATSERLQDREAQLKEKDETIAMLKKSVVPPSDVGKVTPPVTPFRQRASQEGRTPHKESPSA